MGSLILIAVLLLMVCFVACVIIICLFRQKKFEYWEKHGGYSDSSIAYCRYHKENDHSCNECKDKKRCKGFAKKAKILTFIVTMLMAISIVLIFGLVVNLNSITLQGEINAFTANKELIEKSIYNDKLSGLERIELVKQSTEMNSWLATTQAHMKKWTAFDYSNDIKDVLFLLEYIDLAKT